MKDRNTTLGAVGLVGIVWLAVAACQPTDDATGDSAETGADSSARGATLADVVFAADEAFNSRTQELGAAGWTDAFAPDGRLIVSGREVVGKAAIREAMEPILADVRLEWAPSRAVARAGSDLAYTVGRYRAVPREHPDSVVGTGTYVTIWERQADGEWRVSLDVGSPDPQPEGP
jgi:uncharacterized protein (TIGR02246 family)